MIKKYTKFVKYCDAACKTTTTTTTTTTGHDMPGEENRLAIDLTVFKLIGMYQMVDPDSPKVCGRNVYASVNVALIVCTTAMTVLSTCGFFSGVRDTFRNNDFDVVLILFYYACIGVGNYKTTVLVLNAAEVWTLFGVARVSFLGNRYCTGNRRRMADRGASLSRFFAWYLALIVVTLTSYAIIPLVTNHRYAGPTSAPGGGAYRKSNVINLRYPFAADTYNTYYPAFYAMECALAFYAGYGTFAFDLFALTTMYFVSVQYELLASAFRALERGADTGTVDDCSLLNEEELQEHLLSLISDCQTIYK
uniref:Uncharacterized protein n=1 Tax=Sipha flava TaxID=143950 RepID=A0A2S2QX92_9HEMI